MRIGKAAGPACWLAWLAISPISVQGVESQVSRGHVPAAVRHLSAVGSVPATQRLNLAIGLPLRNPELLTNLLDELYNPDSPRFHQYVTPEQFAETFGPTEQDYEAVVAFAKASGFTITARHSNRMLLSVNAAAADIERALHTEMRLYPHPSENRTFYAPASEPVLDLAVPILHISGLDNFEVPHPNVKIKPPQQAGSTLVNGQNSIPQTGSAPNGNYWGLDFRKAYAPGVTLNGAGQAVGLLEFDGYFLPDVRNYAVKSGITVVPTINVLLDGFDGTPGADNIEVALDIEMASAMASGLSAIIVYEAGPGGAGNDILNRMATDNLAKQLSASWTFPSDATTTQIFQQFAAQGQSYFNASGDHGAYAGAISSPCDNPYVTCVGGTTLQTTNNSSRTWIGETVWQNSTDATGGGISTSFAIPSWQQGIDMSSSHGSSAQRNIPDIAMVADQVWCIHDNGQAEAVGGTSCSSPLWAAFTALVNQQAAAFGRPSVGFLNPIIYDLASGTGYAADFHDIVAGNNTNSTSPNNFFAVTGYDLCTGLGSPKGQALIDALAPRLNAIVLTNFAASIATEGCAPANGVIDPGETVLVNFSLKNIGAIPTTNLVVTLQADSGVLFPSGPQVYYGALTGGGAAVSRSFSFLANGACGSNLVATLLLADGATSLGSLTVTFPLGKPIVSFTQNFDTGVIAPNLPANWSRAVSGQLSNWVTTASARDSGSFAAFVFDTTNSGIAELISPAIPISNTSAQLVFRQSYNTETFFDDLTNAYDGGVLEIQVGSGAYADILAAGGSFAAGGYTKTIKSDPPGDNPLDGRQVWAGVTIGFKTTVVNLPDTAAGQSVRFKWRFGSDNGNYFGGLGWYVDTVSVQDGYGCCGSPAPPTISAQPISLVVPQGSNATFKVTVFNTSLPAYQWQFNGTNIPGATSARLSLTNVQPEQAGGYQVIVTNAAGTATSSVAQLTVLVPPTISLAGIGLTATNVSLSLTSDLGRTYLLEYKNSLTDSNWTPLLPPLSGSGGVLTLQDTNPPVLPSRFYRVNSY